MGKFLLLGILWGCSRWRIVPDQQRKVTDKPTSSGDGNDLTDVAMIAKGSLVGTNTVTDGKYTIYLPDGIITFLPSFMARPPGKSQSGLPPMSNLQSTPATLSS